VRAGFTVAIADKLIREGYAKLVTSPAQDIDARLANRTQKKIMTKG
jgi:hypothetical protein